MDVAAIIDQLPDEVLDRLAERLAARLKPTTKGPQFTHYHDCPDMEPLRDWMPRFQQTNFGRFRAWVKRKGVPVGKSGRKVVVNPVHMRRLMEKEVGADVR